MVKEYDQTREEADLLRKCKEKDPRSWEVFVRKYTKFVYHCICTIMREKGYQPSTEEVEDIHSDVWLLILKNLESFKENCPVGAWIRVIAMNTTLQYLIKWKKPPIISLQETNKDGEKPLSETIPHERKPPDEELIDSDLANKIKREVIKQLTPDEQLFMALYYEDDLSYDEITKIMHRTKNNLFQIHHRALSKIRRLMDQEKFL